jgi:hypothetical protein
LSLAKGPNDLGPLGMVFLSFTVRVGGWARSAYSYSLGIAPAWLFVLTFGLYLRYGAKAENAEAHMHGRPATSTMCHRGSAQFLFESFQNWQCVFLSTARVVVLSFFLRSKGRRSQRQSLLPTARGWLMP